jgi:hypothetical protein
VLPQLTPTAAAPELEPAIADTLVLWLVHRVMCVALTEAVLCEDPAATPTAPALEQSVVEKVPTAAALTLVL